MTVISSNLTGKNNTILEEWIQFAVFYSLNTELNWWHRRHYLHYSVEGKYNTKKAATLNCVCTTNPAVYVIDSLFLPQLNRAQSNHNMPLGTQSTKYSRHQAKLHQQLEIAAGTRGTPGERGEEDRLPRPMDGTKPAVTQGGRRLDIYSSGSWRPQVKKWK